MGFITVNKTFAGNPARIKAIRAAAFAFILAAAATLLPACGAPINTNAANNQATTAQTRAAATETATYPAGSRLDAILEKCEIVVATSPDFAPMEFIDNRESGQAQYVGIDPWFARYIAEELNVSLRIEPMRFEALAGALQSGDADLVMSGLAATEERAKTFELSDYYNIETDDGQRIVVLKENGGKYGKADDFKNKKVAALSGSPQYELLKKQLPQATPAPIEDIDDGVMMLLKKEVGALAVDSANGRIILENYPDFTTAGFRFESEPVGNVIAMPKGELALKARVNEVIAKAAGEDVFTKWRKEAKELAGEIGWQN